VSSIICDRWWHLKITLDDLNTIEAEGFLYIEDDIVYCRQGLYMNQAGRHFSLARESPRVE